MSAPEKRESLGHLLCLALPRMIHKPEVMETFLREAPNITERCLPEALRKYLGLNRISTRREALNSLLRIWSANVGRALPAGRLSSCSTCDADGDSSSNYLQAGDAQADPRNEDEYQHMSRQEKRWSDLASIPHAPGTEYSPYSKYEHCVLDVKRHESDWCAEHHYPMHTRDPDGHACANPWAVCHHSTGE